MRLILLDGLWFVHIPFSSMVKFQYIEEFPVVFILMNNSLYLYLRKFATFT